MNRIIILLFFGVQIICACEGKSQHINTSNSINTLLWEVSGNGLEAPSYFLGTMHILCPEDAVLSTEVKVVLQNVGVVYFEIDMDDLSQMLGSIKAMVMKDGVTLNELLTKEEYSRVEQYFNGKSPLPFGMLRNYKPLLLSSMVAEQQLPCEATNGMELVLMNEVTKLKKEILGLETMAFQIGLFDSIPYQEQAKELLKSIDSLHSNRAEIDSLLKAYRNQDLALLEQLTQKEEGSVAGNLELLLFNRNRNWAEQFDSISKKQSTLFAVGAGHLPGKEGVLELLKRKGYTIRPLTNSFSGIKKSL